MLALARLACALEATQTVGEVNERCIADEQQRTTARGSECTNPFLHPILPPNYKGRRGKCMIVGQQSRTSSRRHPAWDARTTRLAAQIPLLKEGDEGGEGVDARGGLGLLMDDPGWSVRRGRRGEEARGKRKRSRKEEARKASDPIATVSAPTPATSRLSTREA